MKSAVVFSSLLAAISIAAVALGAEPEDAPSPRKDVYALAPTKAFELGMANGYGQGFGAAAHDKVGIGDLSSGGFSTQLSLNARINPYWSLGGYVEGSRFFSGNAVPDDTLNYSAAFGVQAEYHLMPFARIGPWVGVGTGLRGYWVDRPHADMDSMYGVDILRLRVGADYKLGASTSIGPIVGATLSTLLAYDDATTREAKDIDSPGVSTFVFAGIQGRFEIGGKRVGAGGKEVASR